jgi:UDP-N-acetyl-D-glucosamine dehydrogenase
VKNPLWPSFEGKEIVVVMGVGFVGAVMAAIVADTVDKKPTGKPSKFVIGCQRPSTRSYWKIPMLNRGESPVKAEDPEVDPMIARCVNGQEDPRRHLQQRLPEAGRLRGRRRPVRLQQAGTGQHEDRRGRDGALEGHHADDRREDPAPLPGADRDHRRPGHDRVRRLADPEEGLRRTAASSDAAAGHSFERVMPGREYVSSSIRDFWRVCSGCNPEARQRVVKFLTEVLNTEKFPLTVMDRPIESETTKIVENSYRATILAFLNEWSLFAERNGVDLIKVIRPSRCARRTAT